MSRDASIAESEHFPASSRGRPGRIARRWLRHLPAALLLLILLLLSGPPIIGVLLTSLQTGAYSAHPEWTLANYAGLVREVGAGGAILNSLIFALGASTVALLFGLPMALIVERTDTAFRHLGYVIAIMFSAVPATVYAIAWMLMFSRQGFANVSFGYLADLLGYEFQPLQITNMAGMILVEGLNYVPLAFLLLAGPVRSMDTSLEEAALTSGAEPWQVFWRITIPPLVPAVVATLLLTMPVGLIAKQPDLGTAILVLAAGMYVLFFAGLGWKWIVPPLVLGLAAAVLLVVFEPTLCADDMEWPLMREYQRQRICTLLDPWRDPLGKGFHIIQGMIAIGSGGFFGKGFMQGTQTHLDFIPERTTDFIFAAYGEEFGLLGNLLLIAGFVFLVLRGLAISLEGPTLFARLLAGRLTLIFFTYAFVNMGMVSGILPVVGVPLPFISYGGTAMVTLGFGIGILLSVAKAKQLVQS